MGRTSAEDSGARREHPIIMIDFASPTQALAKVRVHVIGMYFVGYLYYHKLGDARPVTSKAHHREA